jgi:hypothetical protein
MDAVVLVYLNSNIVEKTLGQFEKMTLGQFEKMTLCRWWYKKMTLCQADIVSFFSDIKSENFKKKREK